ncbi:hypothetical protein [Salmonella enterica]|uniref:hypothetical protein n=1 Tax=Salmonella enterica TaxID=28901 RepID=UPI0013757D6C|nr:hypothetical protein [Salmonella enterica]
MRYTHIIHLNSKTLVAKRNRLASLFNFDGALTKREQIPSEMGLGCRQKPTSSAEALGNEYAVRVSRLAACNTKAISHED